MSTRKGIKRTKNKPVLYSELKKGHDIFLTDSSWNQLKNLAKQKAISVSEFIEQWGRETTS